MELLTSAIRLILPSNSYIYKLIIDDTNPSVVNLDLEVKPDTWTLSSVDKSIYILVFSLFLDNNNHNVNLFILYH